MRKSVPCKTLEMLRPFPGSQTERKYKAMKEPKIVKEPIVYYSIHLWKNRTCYGRQLAAVYMDLDKAVRVFRDIVKTNKYEMANIRKNEVWKRDEFTEISASAPIVKYPLLIQ